VTMKYTVTNSKCWYNTCSRRSSLHHWYICRDRVQLSLYVNIYRYKYLM